LPWATIYRAYSPFESADTRACSRPSRQVSVNQRFKLLAALRLRLCVKKFSRGYQLDKISLQLLNRPAVKCLSRLAKSFVWRSTISGLLLSILILTNPASALAQEVTCVLVSPSQPLTAGTRGVVWLYCLNNSSNEVSRTFEPSLNSTLTSGSNSFNTVLMLTNRSGIEATIAPGSFVKQEYLFDVPPTLGGQVTLDASNYNQVVILVINNPAELPRPCRHRQRCRQPTPRPLFCSWNFSAGIFTVTSRFISSWASTRRRISVQPEIQTV